MFVVGDLAGGWLVAAANGPARETGVRVGMTRRAAEAVCPSGISLERDPEYETRSFESVVGAVEDLVPQVEVVEPGLVFVPVDGAVRYYGGEQAVVDRVVTVVNRLAEGTRFGVAGGPFAAYWAARLADPISIVTDDQAFLSELDVSVLDTDELVATFKWLGVTTLGRLAALPRAAVVSRFGSAGLEAHRLASGEDRTVLPRRVPVDLSVEDIFEVPLCLLEQVGFAARRLAGRLMGLLDQHQVAPYRVVVEAESADGQTRVRVWRSAEPFDRRSVAERVWWQLRAWVETGGVPGGLVRLKLIPADLSGEGYQPTLLEDTKGRVEAERALERTRSILGPDSVLQARPQGGRDPVERVQWTRWGEEFPKPVRPLESPWPGKVPQPSPALVPPRPQLLDMEWDAGVPTRVRLASRWEPVVAWAGPWKRTGRWWTGEEPFDLYQIVTSAGAVLCRITGDGAVLVGVYD